MGKAKPSIDSAKTRKPRTKKEAITTERETTNESWPYVKATTPQLDADKAAEWTEACAEIAIGDEITKRLQRFTEKLDGLTPQAEPDTIAEILGDKRSAPAAKPQAKSPNASTAQIHIEGTEELHTGSTNAIGRLGTGDSVDSTTPSQPAPTTDPKQTKGAMNERTTHRQTEGKDGGSEQDIHSSQPTPQTESDMDAGNAGDVPLSVAEAGTLYGTASLAREETRAQASNRWIREGRRWETDRFRKDMITQGVAAGLTREQAADRAWEACFAKFPPPGTEPEVSTIVDITPLVDEPQPEAAPPAPPVDMGVSGLGDLPESWGTLPANASLQAEIAWVSANRLRVRSGNGVDLSRALSPAPSYSALSWLETSILFPSKFADISVKATATQDDERAGIRREKLAIEEIRGLLAEMLE